MPASIVRRTPATRQSRTRRSNRDALVQSHIGLVHHVARQLARRLGDMVELDELVSAGAVGLLQAVDTFDASRGLSFSTYAVPRIRGAILDEVRKLDGVPRNVRRRTRELARAKNVVANVLLRAPSRDEIARVMNVSADAVHRWEADAHGAIFCSLDQPAGGDEGDVSATLADTVAEETASGVEDLLNHEAEVHRLRQAIARLKEQERTVLALNFFEELKLHEIAQVLGVSVCRISQIRTAALGKLRVVLSDLRAA